MAQETNQTQAPLMCAMGCGFYGNPRTNSMCSVCYKDFLQRQNGSGRVNDPVSTSFSTLGESLPTQSDKVMAASASQLNSQSIVTAAETAQAETTSGESQDELKTEVVAGASNSAAVASVQENVKGELSGSVGSVEVPATGEKRIMDTMLQLDGESTSESDVSVQSPSTKEENSLRKRCFSCNRKLFLSVFSCRCGNTYCPVHRYSDVHNCTYNYKAEGAEKIKKENPVVMAEKITKI